MTSEIVRWSVIHLSLVGRFNFNHATIAEVKMVAESNVGRDLNDRLRMMSTALLIRIGAKNECAFSQYRTGNNADRDTASIFLCFETNDRIGQVIRLFELDIQCAWEESHSGLAKIIIVQFLDPVGEVPHPGYNLPAKYRQLHLLCRRIVVSPHRRINPLFSLVLSSLNSQSRVSLFA